MLASLVEFLPWLKHWQNAPREDFVGERLGNDDERYVEAEARALGRMLDDIRG